MLFTMPLSSSSLQLFPIKLVPGFIAVDFAVGCVGCNFCVARRNALINRFFDEQSISSLDAAEVVRVYEFLSELPSFKARIPIRVGNDSDFAFQRTAAHQLVSELPSDYPVVVLTRFPLTKDDQCLFSEQRANVLLKVTLTPPSRYLTNPVDPYRVLRSLSNVRGNLLVTIGPLVADNASCAKELLSALPIRRNLSVYLKRLDKSGLPDIANVPELIDEDLSELQWLLDQRGFRHNSFMLCLIFGRLGLEDPRSVDVPKSEFRHCLSCASRILCWKDSVFDRERFVDIGRSLGLSVGAVQKTGFRSYRVSVNLPSAYGDEAYFSFVLKRKVRLSETLKGTDGNSVLATPAVIERWRRTGFFPIERLSVIGRTH